MEKCICYSMAPVCNCVGRTVYAAMPPKPQQTAQPVPPNGDIQKLSPSFTERRSCNFKRETFIHELVSSINYYAVAYGMLANIYL